MLGSCFSGALVTREFFVRRQLAAFLTAATIGISGSALALEEPGRKTAVADAAAPETAREEQTEDPRIGYYVSETEEYGFVLDRTGEKGSCGLTSLWKYWFSIWSPDRKV